MNAQEPWLRMCVVDQDKRIIARFFYPSDAMRFTRDNDEKRWKVYVESEDRKTLQNINGEGLPDLTIEPYES